MHRPIIHIIVLIFLASCTKTIESNNKLIIAKNKDGLYLWNGKEEPKPFLMEEFKNKCFVLNPFKKDNNNLSVLTVDSITDSFNFSKYMWSEFSIDLRENSNKLIAKNEFIFNGLNGSTSRTLKKEFRKDSIAFYPDTAIIIVPYGSDRLDITPASMTYGEVIPKCISNGCLYVDKGEVHYNNGKINKLFYKYTDYGDVTTGNGIFNIDISEDGKIIIIPILKTSLFQWLTSTGQGEVLLYDVDQEKIVQRINKRMNKPKISPDKKQIAYHSYNDNIMIYDITSGKSEKIFDRDEYEWIE